MPALAKKSTKGMKAPEAQKIIIPKPDLRIMQVDIKGLSPLIVNKWSEKAKREIEEKQAGVAKSRKRPKRDPEAEYLASMYTYGKKGYGFPAAAFRLAAVGACRMIDGLSMVQARLLFVMPQELIELKGFKKPVMDTRPIRLANGSADLRYRGLFDPWKTTLDVRYNAGAIDPEQIVNLLVLAGECIGVGEMRPEKGGNYGRFTIG